MIRFEKVAFRYPDRTEKKDQSLRAACERTSEVELPETCTPSVFEGVSFCLKKGELVGLAGGNGAGKSTIALLAAGLRLPTAGSVTVVEVSTASRDPEIQRRVGILFQSPDHQIVGITVEEDLAFGLENLGISRDEMHSRVRHVAEAFGLGQYLRVPVKHLSGGVMQRLAIAGVMVMEPDFLILDEPTSQLDPWARREAWKQIVELQSSHGLGILVISQQPFDLERVPRMLVVANGRLAFDGASGDLWKHPEVGAWGIRVPESALMAGLLTTDNLR
ncbi:MAG: ATP-binding cassette domain-containing protein [Candidatus Riflebacteria bacterium]|nr:ATP-binding cassette domain-containing protein [Candidatus Riflebacteria bacterium]